MTTPNPDRAEIVERLRRNSDWRDERWRCVADPELLVEAADLIEQDAKQIEELDRIASDLQALCDQQAFRIAKLTEALEKVLERVEDCDYVDDETYFLMKEALADRPAESQDIR